MSNLRKRLAAVALMAVAASFAALPAFASTPTVTSSVNTAVSGAAGNVTDMITTNTPIILGVVVGFVLLGIGIKLVRKLRS